jgi:hypothetical protein
MAIGREPEHWAECLSEGRRIFRNEVFNITHQKLRIKTLEEKLTRETLELARLEDRIDSAVASQYSKSEILDAKVEFNQNYKTKL